MRVSHTLGNVSAVFDDPNLVSCAALAPVFALAHRCGLAELVAGKLTLPVPGGVNAHLKVPALIGGMVAGADSIDDMDLLRHGGMDRLFAGVGPVRAPSTLGTFLPTFTFGHVRQLDSVAATMLTELARRSPLLAGGDELAYVDVDVDVDVDDTVKATYGYAKQGAGYGYSGVKGLNALIATVSTPLSAPVICATRLRKGSTNSARGASRLVADALVAAKAAGAGGSDGQGLIVLRADSAFYNHDVIAAARRAGVRFWHHRSDEPRPERSDQRHRRGRLDAHHLPQRGLGRRRAAADQRHRDRRDHLHGVHQPPHSRPHQRPADRPPRQTPQPHDHQSQGHDQSDAKHC